MQTTTPQADDTLRSELDQAHETSTLINQFGAAVALQTSTGHALITALEKNRAMRNQLREALEEPKAIAPRFEALPIEGKRDIDPVRKQKLSDAITEGLPRVLDGMRERMNRQSAPLRDTDVPPPIPDYPASYDPQRYAANGRQ